MPGSRVLDDWTVTKSSPFVVGLKFWVSLPMMFAEAVGAKQAAVKVKMAVP